eukprot:7154894-Prymnesium_polylepis.1
MGAPPGECGRACAPFALCVLCVRSCATRAHTQRSCVHACMRVQLNKGALDCFLMETTAACFLKADDQPNAPAGAALIDALFDSCGSKGTGKWTVKQARSA